MSTVMRELTHELEINPGRRRSSVVSLFTGADDRNSHDVFQTANIHHEHIIRTGRLEKRVPSRTNFLWNGRAVTLTKNSLVVAFEDQPDRVCESISLEDLDRACENLTSENLRTKKKLVSARSMRGRLPDDNQFENLFSVRTVSSESNTGDCVDEMEWKNSFRIHLYKLGRVYHFKASSPEDCAEWIEAINKQLKLAESENLEKQNRSRHDVLRDRLKSVYEAAWCQGAICLILGIVFGLNIFETEVNPEEGSEWRRLLNYIDFAVTAMFVLELCVQIFVYKLAALMKKSWIMLDMLVLLFCIVETAMVAASSSSSHGSNLELFRLLRLSRVARLFTRLTPLQKVVSAVTSAMGPVLNAFFVSGFLNCIYAVIGTRLFAREVPEHFATFGMSAMTMLQLATFDSWIENVLRPMLDAQDNAWGKLVVWVFVMSFVMIMSLVMMNVMITLMLEGFANENERKARERWSRQAAINHQQSAGFMDGLLVTLANYTSHVHLRSQLKLLFQTCDVGARGVVSFAELKSSLERMEVVPAIRLSEEDFDHFTDGKRLCEQDGTLSAVSFEKAMLWQLQLFAQRLVATRMQETVNQMDPESTLLFAIKIALSELFLINSTQTAETKALQHLGEEAVNLNRQCASPVADSLLPPNHPLANPRSESSCHLRRHSSPTHSFKAPSHGDSAAGPRKSFHHPHWQHSEHGSNSLIRDRSALAVRAEGVKLGLGSFEIGSGSTATRVEPVETVAEAVAGLSTPSHVAESATSCREMMAQVHTALERHMGEVRAMLETNNAIITQELGFVQATVQYWQKEQQGAATEKERGGKLTERAVEEVVECWEHEGGARVAAAMAALGVEPGQPASVRLRGAGQGQRAGHRDSGGGQGREVWVGTAASDSTATPPYSPRGAE